MGLSVHDRFVVAALAVLGSLSVVACSSESAEDTASGLTPASGGGYCCPVQGPTCDCFRNGGWTPTNDVTSCPRVCDMAPPATTTTDAHGCAKLVGSGSCLRPGDAGGGG